MLVYYVNICALCVNNTLSSSTVNQAVGRTRPDYLIQHMPAVLLLILLRKEDFTQKTLYAAHGVQTVVGSQSPSLMMLAAFQNC